MLESSLSFPLICSHYGFPHFLYVCMLLQWWMLTLNMGRVSHNDISICKCNPRETKVEAFKHCFCHSKVMCSFQDALSAEKFEGNFFRPAHLQNLNISNKKGHELNFSKKKSTVLCFEDDNFFLQRLTPSCSETWISAMHTRNQRTFAFKVKVVSYSSNQQSQNVQHLLWNQMFSISGFTVFTVSLLLGK